MSTDTAVVRSEEDHVRTPARLRFGIAAALSLTLIGMASASGSTPAPDGRNQPPGSGVTAQAAPSPNPQESLFVPVAPCRVADTRVAGGRITAGTTRQFYVGGTTGFAPQGGKPGGCGIPAVATAVAATVLSVNATSANWLVAYPSAVPAPLATTLFFQKSQVSGTGTTVSLSPGTGKQLAVKSAGTTDVVLDVNGYYLPQLAAYVETNGALGPGSSRVLSSVRNGTGNYTVTFDRPMAGCSFQVTPYAYNWEVAVGPTGPNAATIYIHDNVSPYAGHDTSFFITATC